MVSTPLSHAGKGITMYSPSRFGIYFKSYADGPGRYRPFTLLAGPGQLGQLVYRIWATVAHPVSVRHWRSLVRPYKGCPGLCLTYAVVVCGGMYVWYVTMGNTTPYHWKSLDGLK